MARTVITREDGFFGVSGQPLSVYYSDKESAARVAANLDAADDHEGHGVACETDGDYVDPESD